MLIYHSLFINDLTIYFSQLSKLSGLSFQPRLVYWFLKYEHFTFCLKRLDRGALRDFTLFRRISRQRKTEDLKFSTKLHITDTKTCAKFSVKILKCSRVIQRFRRLVICGISFRRLLIYGIFK